MLSSHKELLCGEEEGGSTDSSAHLGLWGELEVYVAGFKCSTNKLCFLSTYTIFDSGDRRFAAFQYSAPLLPYSTDIPGRVYMRH